MFGDGGCSRILICLLSPGSNWAPQDVVIFKSDMADPAHLQCVIMHQVQRCGLKLSLMLCALGFIFPIKSANYMIIQSYVQGPFWKWVAMVCIPPPPLMVMLEMRSALWQEYQSASQLSNYIAYCHIVTLRELSSKTHI